MLVVLAVQYNSTLLRSGARVLVELYLLNNFMFRVLPNDILAVRVETQVP
jgi:hypothetical protein